MFGRMLGGGVRAARGFGKNVGGRMGHEMLGQAMGIDTSRSTGRPTMGGAVGGRMVQQGRQAARAPAVPANASARRRVG